MRKAIQREPIAADWDYVLSFLYRVAEADGDALAVHIAVLRAMVWYAPPPRRKGKLTGARP
jgi:hypothetical protein